MDLEPFFAAVREQVDARLAAALEALPAGRLREAMGYSLFGGGKRLRPALCCAAAELCGEPNALTLAAAAAVELIHAYSLVHDDLPAMDDDQLRRGRPTCHVAFDEATAILAGDALQALAFAVLAEAEGDPATRVELIRLLAQAAGAAGMVLGQAEDLEATGRSLDLEALERMHRHKTGALICASLELGARSAGANGEELEALRRYGDALGLAFQIRDDILDVESSAEQLGKTPGSDAARNKPTYASVLGLAEARSRLEAAHAAALDALKPFGERARTLRALAHFAAHRIH